MSAKTIHYQELGKPLPLCLARTGSITHNINKVTCPVCRNMLRR